MTIYLYVSLIAIGFLVTIGETKSALIAALIAIAGGFGYRLYSGEEVRAVVADALLCCPSVGGQQRSGMDSSLPRKQPIVTDLKKGKEQKCQLSNCAAKFTHVRFSVLFWPGIEVTALTFTG